ncbi:Fe-S cluster assembly ATPase SufC [Microgenomates group bacterium]|nr:Fe-S cluster assembly ATPase SufC [Microgenomates group bacterium]
MLRVQYLKLKIKNKLILNNVSLEIRPGEVVALMGPNGSGKSSLANALVGNPVYPPVGGQASIDGKNLLNLKPDERAKLGLFLAWQNPPAVSGVSVESLLRITVLNCGQRQCQTVCAFREELNREAVKLKINNSWLNRGINVGFSGGEKKKLELLQLLLLKPKYAILDEIDSGLDIDSLKLLAKISRPQLGILLITHYTRIFKYLKPNKVLVMKQGRIAASGGLELIKKIEKDGYGSY